MVFTEKSEKKEKRSFLKKQIMDAGLDPYKFLDFLDEISQIQPSKPFSSSERFSAKICCFCRINRGWRPCRAFLDDDCGKDVKEEGDFSELDQWTLSDLETLVELFKRGLSDPDLVLKYKIQDIDLDVNFSKNDSLTLCALKLNFFVFLLKIEMSCFFDQNCLDLESTNLDLGLERRNLCKEI